MFGNYVHIKGFTEKLGKYYCEDCKEWFDELYIKEYDEPRGEYWGIPCSEHRIERHCPYCDSEDRIYADDIILDDEEESVTEHPDDFDPWTNYDRMREI